MISLLYKCKLVLNITLHKSDTYKKEKVDITVADSIMQSII